MKSKQTSGDTAWWNVGVQIRQSMNETKAWQRKFEEAAEAKAEFEKGKTRAQQLDAKHLEYIALASR